MTKQQNRRKSGDPTYLTRKRRNGVHAFTIVRTADGILAPGLAWH